MTRLPDAEIAFFFQAMGQLAPELRPVFAERVANTLGAYSPFCEPGPGDVDRAIRAAVRRLVDPACDRGGAAVSRWDQAKAEVRAGVEAGGLGRRSPESRRSRSQRGHNRVSELVIDDARRRPVAAKFARFDGPF